MTSSDSHRLGSLARGVSGMLIFAVALGTAVAIGDWAAARGVDGLTVRWLRALTSSALAVALVASPSSVTRIGSDGPCRWPRPMRCC
jgi:hypothetical protein